MAKVGIVMGSDSDMPVMAKACRYEQITEVAWCRKRIPGEITAGGCT